MNSALSVGAGKCRILMALLSSAPNIWTALLWLFVVPAKFVIHQYFPIVAAVNSFQLL